MLVMKKTSIIFLLLLISCGPSEAEMQIEKEATAEAEKRADVLAELALWYATSTTSTTTTTTYLSSTVGETVCVGWSIHLNDIKNYLFEFGLAHTLAMQNWSSFDRTAVASYSDPGTVAMLKYDTAFVIYWLSQIDPMTAEFLSKTYQGMNTKELTEEHLSVARLLDSYVFRFVKFYKILDESFDVGFIDNEKMTEATSKLIELNRMRDELNLLIGNSFSPREPAPSFCDVMDGE